MDSDRERERAHSKCTRTQAIYLIDFFFNVCRVECACTLGFFYVSIAQSLHKKRMKRVLRRKWMGIVYLEKIDKVIYFTFCLSFFLSYASIGNWLFTAQCVVGMAAHCTLFSICMALTQFCLVEWAFFPDPIEPLCYVIWISTSIHKLFCYLIHTIIQAEANSN